MQIKTGRDDRLTNVAIIRKTNNIASFGSGMVPNGLCVKKLGSRVALLGDCRLWEVASYGDLPISWRMPLKGSWRTRIGFLLFCFFCALLVHGQEVNEFDLPCADMLCHRWTPNSRTVPAQTEAFTAMRQNIPSLCVREFCLSVHYNPVTLIQRSFVE